MRRRLAILVLIALGTASCASAGSGRSTTGTSDRIGPEELENLGQLDAYEAVQRLRPQWLRVRGSSSFNQRQGVRLYVDGVPRGYAGELASFRADIVESMRFLDGREATTRYGTDHGNGAILVELKM
jgi:hypothetical protein